MKDENILIPPILYKYKNLFFRKDDNDYGYNEHTQKMLKFGVIRFSNPNEFDDPYELFYKVNSVGAPQIPLYLSQEEYEDLRLHFPNSSLEEKYSDKYKCILNDEQKSWYHHRNIINNRNGKGIFCLTEDRNSIQMHAQYANGFKGVCVGFDWNLMFNNNFCPIESDIVGSWDGWPSKPRKVIYNKSPICLSNADAGEAQSFFKAFITKHVSFGWEQEWRLFHPSGNIGINRESIKEIIFGCRVPHNIIKEVKTWVSDVNGITFFIAKPSISEYAINIIPI